LGDLQRFPNPFLTLQPVLQQAQQLQIQQLKEQQGELVRLQQQRVERQRQIRQEARRLLQQRELLDITEKMVNEDPELLCKKLREGLPVTRFIAIKVISKRRLPIEKDLVEALKVTDETIRQTARGALVHICRGTDFGPIPGTSQAGISRSVEKWQHWLALQHSESPQTTAVAVAAKEDKIDPAKAVNVVLGLADRTLQTVSPEATQLCDELVKARGDGQMSVLARLRDAKGIDNTDALALAIPKLPVGAAQREARDALAQRLTRMTAATLRDKLQEDAVEVRRAAALACGRKKATEHIPDLLQLLDDPEVAVIQAARTALKELSGEDFGPDEEAGRRGRASAAVAWRKWWKEHQSEQ
jgi:hypothetical protein